MSVQGKTEAIAMPLSITEPYIHMRWGFMLLPAAMVLLHPSCLQMEVVADMGLGNRGN
jgi:hypothetical protein